MYMSFQHFGNKGRELGEFKDSTSYGWNMKSPELGKQLINTGGGGRGDVTSNLWM